MIFRNIYWYIKIFSRSTSLSLRNDMDEHGYFNFSVAAGMSEPGGRGRRRCSGSE
jgi:hypothetical protein